MSDLEILFIVKNAVGTAHPRSYTLIQYIPKTDTFTRWVYPIETIF